MSDSRHIAYENKLRPSEDFEHMLKEGISYISKLSGDLWTDFNTHDPGITLLEQFCFVLTDLGFRTQDDLALAFEHPERGVIDRLHDMGVFQPTEILSFAPLTQKDYRKFILGHLFKRVRNCWFPRASDKNGYKGLYECRIILTHEAQEEVLGFEAEDVAFELEYMRRQVLGHYHANRNLCENLDKQDIQILEPLFLTFYADIEIEPNYEGEQVVADILLALEDYVNPAVPITKIVDEDPTMAHNNPMRDNLHIDDRHLTPRRTAVAGPKVKELILQIPGVRTLKDSFRLLFDGHSNSDDAVTIDEANYPTFGQYFYGDIDQLPPLRITKDGVAYSFGFERVREVIRFKTAQAKQDPTRESKKNKQPKDRDQAPKYQSVQYGLPGIFNVGKYGPMPDASRREKENAKRLRSFLLLFDVFLASQIKQLVEADVLFDANQVEPTYRLADPEEMDIPAAPGEESVPYEPLLQDLNRRDLDRKSRVIEHALARLGDKFEFDSQNLRSIQSLSTEGSTEKYALLQSRLKAKAAFLKEYANFSKWRYSGFDLQKPHELEANVAHLKKRFATMLGIEEYHDISLVKHLEDPNEAEQPRGKQARKRWLELELPSGEKYVALADDSPAGTEGEFTFPLKDGAAIRNFYTLGVFFRNYEVVDMENGTFIVLYRPTEGPMPVKVMEANSHKEAIDGMTRLVHHLRRVSKRSEGFFFVEHILLQKKDSTDIKIVFKMDDLKVESIKYFHHSGQSEQIQKLLELASDKSNIFIEKARGEYLIQIGPTKMDPIFKTSRSFITKKEAESVQSEIINAFANILPTIGDLKDYFFVLRDGTTPNWCNNRMTLIFPNWVSRFQTKAFDQMVNKLVHETIPAHIHVQVKKFNIQMMRKFERSYFSWKGGKGSPAGLVNLLKAKDED